MNLSTRTQTRVGLAYDSGTADRTGAIMDMSGWSGILITAVVAAVGGGATYSIKAQQDTASGGGSMADLLGTGITIADDDDDQIFQIDIYKPLERYVRVYVDKDTSNTCAESVIYTLYGPTDMATAGSITDEITLETHISPIEGTA